MGRLWRTRHAWMRTELHPDIERQMLVCTHLNWLKNCSKAVIRPSGRSSSSSSRLPWNWLRACKRAFASPTVRSDILRFLWGIVEFQLSWPNQQSVPNKITCDPPLYQHLSIFPRSWLHCTTPFTHYVDTHISIGFTFVEPPRLSTSVCLLRYKNADSKKEKKKNKDHVAESRERTTGNSAMCRVF